MKAIRYRITTLNPLIISSGRGDTNMVNTESYIPGSNVLGVFASLYIKNQMLNNAHKDDTFYRWFLKGDIEFTNAYIADDSRYYFPNPHSVKQDKYNENVEYDLMFEGDNFNKSTKSGESFVNIKNSTIYGKSVKKSISFHNAREKAYQRKGTIFNYGSISENQIFKGSIIGESEQLGIFRKDFPKLFTAYMGLSKNSQYGKVEIELGDISDYTSDIDTNVESDDTDIVMTLLSNTIVYNECGFSTTDIKDLETLLGVKIKKSFIRKETSEQFVGVWRLKNQSEVVLSAGSCFLLNKLPNNYEELQIRGIGEKTGEGFGRVVFGWQKVKLKSFEKKDMREIEKPNGKPPKLVEKIVAGVIKKWLKDAVIRTAMQDELSFNRIPTKSLCGKLQSISDSIEKLQGHFIEKFQGHFQEVAKNEQASNQLKKCNNGSKRLLDYFKGNEFVDIDSLLNDINGLDEFTNPLKDDSKLREDMARLYLKTFFNFMRKDYRRDQ